MVSQVDQSVRYPLSWEKGRTKPRSTLCDTLSDLPVRNGMTLVELGEMLWGKIVAQKEVQYRVIFGGLDTRWTSPQGWGIGVRFSDQVWYVKSAGRRRIGKPLRQGETHDLVVLAVPAALDPSESKRTEPFNGGRGMLVHDPPVAARYTIVTIIRMRFRAPRETICDLLCKSAVPKNESYGPPGIPIFPIHVWAHQGLDALRIVKARGGASDHQMLFSSHANVYGATDARATKSRAARATAISVPAMIEPGAHPPQHAPHDACPHARRTLHAARRLPPGRQARTSGTSPRRCSG